MFFSIGLNTDTYANDAPKSILILNSYQSGLSWTDDQTDGILSILKKHDNYSNICVEYMDWKTYPYQDNLNQLYSYLSYKYAHKKIDIILTTDDAALEFALKNRKSIFSDAPVVFCGVNEKGVQKVTSGYSNVTGVVEEVAPEKTIKAALEIYPELKNVYVIFDNTESGQSTGSLAIDAVRRANSHLKAIPLNQRNHKEILNKAEKISGNSIILITTYFDNSEGILIGFEDFCEALSQKSHVPVFHLYDFGIGHGAFGGSMLSGRLQGIAAGKLAERVLNGENISAIPISRSKTTSYIFDYSQLKKFNIPLSRVPKGSIIVNKPFSFFEAYKNLVITVLVIFMLLLGFICVLLFYLNKIHKMRRALYHNNLELTSLYEDLTVSGDKLRQQYQELLQTQKNLAESEAQYELLFKKMLNGFCIVEPIRGKNNRLADIRFISANPGFENHTGKKAEELSEKTWTEAFGYTNSNLGFYESILETGESKHFETYYPDTKVYYLINAFKISDVRIGLVIDNITEYKLAIKKVRSLNENLEMRVEERTNELKDAVKELEDFAHTVSHDLKAPLRAVDGYSRIIIEDFGGKMDREANQMLLSIRGICRDMIEMINKLLEYSITSRSTLNLEEINTDEMIRSIFAEIRLTCPERKIDLKIETGLPRVKADKTLFRQVIYNVLSNAVKFTKNREVALIAVGSTITENEYVFYVKDNGVGFNMSYANKLFGIFQRLHTSEEYEGSGIGLVTIKKIIEKHGGKVWIEGKLDEGTSIYFTLPFVW